MTGRDEGGADGRSGGADTPAGGVPAEGGGPELARLRDRILEVDEELVRLVGERRELVLAVGRLKEARGLPVLDPGREARVVRRAAELARAEGIDEELVRDVIWRIVASAREAQEGRTSWGPPEAPGDGGVEGPDDRD